jgi:hypothetical protein
MYPGEAIEIAGGYPALVRFDKAGSGAPLVVFVTGGGVFARVAYGHPESRPSDFLFYWLREAGYSALALTYPLGAPPFEQFWPAFTVADWAEQSAEIVARYHGASAASANVIILAWSMAGRIVVRLAEALRRRRIEIEIFVAMAATPGLPNMLPAFSALAPDAHGLAKVEGAFLGGLLACLQAQDDENGRAAIDPRLFAKDFTGSFPIALAAAGMRYRNEGFVSAPQEDAEDTEVFAYSRCPLIAVLTHASPLDPRHALTDGAVWGFLIVKSLAEARILTRAKDAASMDAAKWARAREIIAGAPARLTLTLPGNHMFFVGEAGARRTAVALTRIRAEVGALCSELNSALS